MEKATRLAICIPLYGGTSAAWVSNLVELVFAFLHDPAFEIQVLTNHSCPVAEARNRMIFQLRKQKEETGWEPDAVLWLDSDNLVTKEQAAQLVSDGCDIASALYFSRKAPHHPVAMQSVPGRKNKRWMAGYKKGALQETEIVGMGCCLMKWAVLEKMMESHTHPFGFAAVIDDNGNPTFQSEDVVFCEHARALGFKIFLDARVVSGHIGGIVEEKDFKQGRE